MIPMDTDLRKYLQRNHDQLTWKERIQITYNIIDALDSIHKEDAIHRDLHSGNILHSPRTYVWYISDLGFCGPADKPLNNIYGNLPFIAPEVIAGKEYTFASDIYSIGMLMWEISSGQPPFVNFEHDYDLAIKIINGMRPKMVTETPLEYKKLMEQCWDADPLRRPNIETLLTEMDKIYTYLQSTNEEQLTNIQLNTNVSISSSIINSLVKNFISKVYIFEGLPEPKNATEGKLFFKISNLYLLFFFYYLLK